MPIDLLNVHLADYENTNSDILHKINELIIIINLQKSEIRRLEDTCIWLNKIVLDLWERNKCQ